MGRTGLRRALLLRLSFCAALATTSMPQAFAQARGPKTPPPQNDSAFHSRSNSVTDKSALPAEVSEPAAPPTGAPPPADGVARGGERGITYPKCLRCPPAQYFYAALIHKVQGTVTMDVIISTEGEASAIKVLGSMGAGLDEQAMKAMRTWQWEPARDADGNPIAVHQIVAITFRAPK